ncbi:PepSY domain-containing protein [Microvirga lotononidis]|uniref:Putative membrane protein n=1 Tax=Microvirga lotononidis TaxID=864069 RepID=I4YKG4_9HYPH|nr:PepSY domain-containing protein [Microvirga lotononidis]EIM24456.1 putative membrane protein [Microvirga lotononidis]WQO31374.1 PepSY domain-containing protein [Microvirga lotononidis]
MLKLVLAGSALALTTSLAFAQTPPAPAAGAPAGVTRDSNKFQAARSAKVSLSQAVEAAEKQGQGRATEAEFEVKDGGGQYEIKVLSNTGDKLTKFKLDANSGQVVETENQPFERYFTRLKPADFQSAKVSLKDAIAAAEQRVGGKATDAEVEREGNAVQYEIDVATADKTQEIKVDANGQVVAKD